MMRVLRMFRLLRLLRLLKIGEYIETLENQARCHLPPSTAFSAPPLSFSDLLCPPLPHL